MVQRSFSFLVLAGLLSCKGDPTGDLRNGTDHLNADPTSLFVRQDSSKFVVITAVDEQGNAVAAKFSDAQGLGPGITVVKDPTFAPVYNSKGELVPPSEVVATRYIVTATANTANSSFDVTADGKTIHIPVRIIPAVLPVAAVTKPASPVAGDTITLTLPAPYRFSGATKASIRTITPPVPPATKPDTTVRQLHVIGLSADSSQLRVVPPPSVNGYIAVTNVVLSYAPAAIAFRDSTTDSVTTPAQPTLVTLSTAAAIGGDTVFVTAPGRYRFVGGSTVTVGTAAAAVASISTDSTQLRFAIGPNANDTVRVAGVLISGAPTLGPFGFKTNVPLVTPAAPPLTLNKTAAAAGDTIVVTAPARYRFTPGGSGSKVTVGTAGLALIGTSTDSTQLRFLIGPSANSAVTVTNLILQGAPSGMGKFTLTSGAAVLSTPAIPTFPSTLSNAAPAIQDTVTLAITGTGFKFLPNATVTNGGAKGFVVSVAADSLSLKYVAVPGTAAGPPTVTGIVLSTLTSVPLTIPSSVSITSPAAYAGAIAVATAPTIVIPAAGVQSVYLDNGPTAAVAECGNIGNHCRFYKIVLAAPRTVKVTLNWGNTADIGGYYIDAAGTDIIGDFACDSKGSGAGGQPESCTEDLPAGTTYLALADFTAAAQNTNFQIVILGQ